MPISLHVGCSPCAKPTRWRVNLIEPTNRRAVCGRSARTVRRGEGPGTQPVLPTPIVSDRTPDHGVQESGSVAVSTRSAFTFVIV